MTLRCYTPEEFAEKRRVSVRTVYRLIKAGKLKTVEKVGRQYRIWVARAQDSTGHDRTNPSTPSV